MWEWSKTNPNQKKSSLYKVYNNLHSKTQDTKKTISNEILSPQQMQDFLQKKITELKLKNIKLKECTYHPYTWSDMLKYFDKYQQIRKKFIKFLGYSCQKECLDIGLTPEDIELLKEGISPENYNTHIKIPFDFGGTLEFENLCLIKTQPCHYKIHYLIEHQIGSCFLQQNKIIYIPWFEGNIYDE